jgi:hypothetical protein
MDGRGYLQLARYLVEAVKTGNPPTGGDGAAKCRSAISRAYYGAYLVAVAYLDRIGFATENSPDCHLAVQRALNNGGNPELRAAYAKLDVLHRDRRRADYDMKDTRSETLATAEFVVKLAEDTTELIVRVRDTATLDEMAAIAAAISAWLKSAQTGALRQKSGTR